MSEAEPVRRGRGGMWKVTVAAMCVALAVGAAIWMRSAAERTEFGMKLVPLPDDVEPMYLGSNWPCSSRSEGDHPKPPTFVSSKPLFGVFRVGMQESGAQEDNRWFALDESKGTGTGYDTLYVDVNGNRDLSDDKPSHKRSLAATRTPSGTAVFDSVTVALADGSTGSQQGIALSPRLSNRGPDAVLVQFPPAFVRQGRIRARGSSYKATLIPRDPVSGRYDDPQTVIRLIRGIRILGNHLVLSGPVEDKYVSLSTIMHGPHDDWFTLSTVASGDVLRVHPYTGDLGILKVSAAGPKSEGLILRGSLYTRGGGVVSLPSLQVPIDSAEAAAPHQIVLPAGDYDIDSLQVMIARKAILFLVQGPRPQGADADSDGGYFIKIRKDQPYVLEIPKEARMEAQAMGGTGAIAPGDWLSVDPHLLTDEFAVQDIEYVQTTQTPTGRYLALMPLAPSAAVTDSSGKELCSMRATTPWTWRLPADFKPRDGREALTLTVTWHTKDLFGVVTGTKEILVEARDTRGGND